jgi:photosystem II stability/assembly factor-like uncharacterized protein
MAVCVFLFLPLTATHADPQGREITVLQQVATISPKMQFAAMLGMAHAGSRLVAVGERGIIQLSDDGGAHWRQVQVPVSVTLTAVQFVDDKRGWAVGHLGVVLHTEDGGSTWVKQLDGRQAAALVLDAAKKQVSMAPSAPATDGALAAAEQLVADGPDKPFLDLYFENARTGYIVGAYNLIFRTDDGGTTWQPWQSHVDNPKGLHLYGLRAAGGALYLVGEQGLLMRSTDGGQSFTRMASPYKGTFFGLVAAASGEIVLYGLRGNAFWSGDQGATWSKIDTGIKASFASGIELADRTLALVSQGGDVVVSHDHGRTFKALAGNEGMPPLTGIAQVRQPNGGARLVVTSLRGVRRLLSATAGKP